MTGRELVRVTAIVVTLSGTYALLPWGMASFFPALAAAVLIAWLTR